MCEYLLTRGFQHTNILHIKQQGGLFKRREIHFVISNILSFWFKGYACYKNDSCFECRLRGGVGKKAGLGGKMGEQKAKEMLFGVPQTS
jgi:hypothetical protein